MLCKASNFIQAKLCASTISGAESGIIIIAAIVGAIMLATYATKR